MSLDLVFLDHFFTWFHASLILFNLFGWIFRQTRRWNLLTLLLTGGSWIFLGFIFGFGYCPFTDWHWQVLNKLGVHDLPPSYVQYLSMKLTGMQLSSYQADKLTVVLYSTALAASLWVNCKDCIGRVFRKETLS